jgi:uncharacterized iron-regulated membrane protein
MTLWQRWVQRPQSLRTRKVLVQVHLWVGLGIGLYIVIISISGSAIVYRRELMRRPLRRTVIVAESGQRISVEELAQRAQRAYPTYEVLNIREAQAPDEPDDIVLERAHKRIERLFDPYTGSDLGNPHSVTDRVVEWLVDLHDNLLTGQTGRLANGIGSCFVTSLSLTGVIIWWPGIKNWRRSTTVNWKATPPRFNWDLHSAIGFWCWFFVLVWGISGIYFCFPAVFSPLFSSSFLSWIGHLHKGRFNRFTEALWTILGLVPAILAGTGALMCWNRVLRKKLRRSRDRQAEHAGTSDNLLVVRE